MKIIVDADGCPAKNIIESVAKKFKLRVLMICDINHVINSDYSEVKYVDYGFQSVDMVIVNVCKKDDIVITQDYGLAAMVLGKKSGAINPKGIIYNDENIDKMLFERHLSAKMRKGGFKTPTCKKRSAEDDKRLENNLIKLIKDKNLMT